MTKYKPWTREAEIIKDLPPDVNALFLQNSPAYAEAIKMNDKVNVIIKEKRIIEELDNPGIPNLKLMFSPEYITVIPWLLDKLLKAKIKEQEMLHRIPKEKLTYSLLYNENSETHFRLNYLWSLVNQYKWLNDSKELRDILAYFMPKIMAFWNKCTYDKDEFEMARYWLENIELDEEQKLIMEKTIKNFEDRWIHLPLEKTERLKTINLEMSTLSKNFSETLLDAQKQFRHFFATDEFLKEMPEDLLRLAKMKAKAEGLDWYLFDASQWDIISILSYCSSSEVRREFMVFTRSIATSWKFDNRENCLKMLQNREELSHILGYENFAEWRLVDEMSGSPEKVMEILEEIQKASMIKWQKDLEILKEYFWIDEIKAWDVSYYARIYRQKEFDIDEKVIRRYFEYDDVLNWLKLVAKEFWDVEMVEIDWEKYNEDLKYFEIYKDGKFKWHYIIDPFSRENKKNWAWNSSLRQKRIVNWRLINAIWMTSLWVSKWNKWWILIWRQRAISIFHEFGHAFHSFLWKSKYPQLIGTAWMERDFVELPSTFMENFVLERESLKRFALDYETREPISDEILEKFEKSRNFLSWINQFGLLDKSFLDLELHRWEAPKTVEELDERVYQILKKYSFFEFSKEESMMHWWFAHIFQWAYSSIYYSYIWAWILNAHVLKPFKQNWMFHRETADRYIDKIISEWSRKRATELYKDFTWEEWISILPYLENANLLW
jgi:oligopeptidase A